MGAACVSEEKKLKQKTRSQTQSKKLKIIQLK